MKNLILIAGALFSLVISAASKESSFAGEIWDNQCAKGGSHEAMMKKAGVNTAQKCTIGCAMTRGKYVLYVPGTRKIYDLDDQKTPLQFAGERVTVTGELDSSTNKIHVTGIQLASAKAGK